MAELPQHPDTDDHIGVGSDRGSTANARRWVAVVGISIAIVAVLLMVVLHLTGTIGPGAH